MLSNEIFNDDFIFSRKHLLVMMSYLMPKFYPIDFVDNKGTFKDKILGHDVTLIGCRPNDKYGTKDVINLSVRIRRSIYYKPEKHIDYTEDDKERDTMHPDIHCLGFANKSGTGIEHLMIFSHKSFLLAKEQNLLHSEIRKNTTHSVVSFTCYPVYYIIKYCVSDFLLGFTEFKTPQSL